MNNKILIIGNHPIIADLTEQYRQRGDVVVVGTLDQVLGKPDIALFKEFVILADYNKEELDADDEAMGILRRIAEDDYLATNRGQRPLCHLLLRNNSVLHLIRLEGFRKEIEERLEVCPFTMVDQWSQAIAISLDRDPITKQSEKIVHLVIFGMSEVAEQVAINAA